MRRTLLGMFRNLANEVYGGQEQIKKVQMNPPLSTASLYMWDLKYESFGSVAKLGQSK